VQLAALKAAGNPLAAGSARPVDPASAALRLVETTGTGTPISLGSDVGAVDELRFADLLEKPLGPTASVHLHGYQVATVLARIETPGIPRTFVEPAPHAEAAQPLYARYWLHNRGPAPLGGLPAVAHLHPQRVTAEPGGGSDGSGPVQVYLGKDCTPTAAPPAFQDLDPFGTTLAGGVFVG